MYCGHTQEKKYENVENFQKLSLVIYKDSQEGQDGQGISLYAAEGKLVKDLMGET